MNKTVELSSLGNEFFGKWKYYKKFLRKSGIKDWTICSDYCVDDKCKNDVLTFTIFPSYSIKKVLSDTKKYLVNDIKHTTKVSSEVISYLRNNEECFSISIILKNKKLFVNNLNEMSEHLHFQIKEYKGMPEDIKNQKKDAYLKIVELVNYIDSKNCDKKLMSHFFIVLQFVAFIMEFLIIKENANIVHWVSDRDKIISFDEEVIYYLLNSCVFLLIKDRKKDYNIGLFHFNELKNFDSILRIPDIITGTLSSISSKDGMIFAAKEKHKDIFCNAIYDNPRTIIIYYVWDKIYGHQEFVVLNHS